MYDKICVETFLKDQLKLFPKKVAKDEEEAVSFLEDCMAEVFPDKKELIKFMKAEGIDYDDNLEEILEVFPLPDGRFLYVEA